MLSGIGPAAHLKAHGVESGADRTVQKILNDEETGSCPMEQAVEGIKDPAAMVKKLKEKVGK